MKNVLYFTAVLAALVLTACSKSKNNNNGSCVYNASTGYSTNTSNGAICSTNSALGGNCVINPATGGYINPQTGGICNTSMVGNCIQTAQGYFINQQTGQPCATQTPTGGYQSGYGQAGYSCASYNQQWAGYGVYYTPVYINGQMMCVQAY